MSLLYVITGKCFNDSNINRAGTLKIRSISGAMTEINQDALDNLRSGQKGMLLLPGDTGYDESRALWNGMTDRKPALIVRCLVTADVILCVKLASMHELLLCIKGGGHNIAGLAIADGGIYA